MPCLATSPCNTANVPRQKITGNLYPAGRQSLVHLLAAPACTSIGPKQGSNLIWLELRGRCYDTRLETVQHQLSTSLKPPNMSGSGKGPEDRDKLRRLPKSAGAQRIDSLPELEEQAFVEIGR